VKCWHKWHPAEDEILRRYYGKWHSKQIADVLERSQKSVWNRAGYLGLSSSEEIRLKAISKNRIRQEITNLARHYDPFGRPLAIFCVKNVTQVLHD
jgi:hypothetical protein